MANVDSQLTTWENVFQEDDEMFGRQHSQPASYAAELFQRQGRKTILELGAGQGRDTFYFARQGFQVTALDYTAAGVTAIEANAQRLGLVQNITVIRHDVRSALPFADNSFDACYSHMLYCMAFTTDELMALSAEINRILKPGGLNVYTARNTADKHYGQGVHHGEDMYEIGGFVVHFFDQAKITALARGYEILDITTLLEGELPRNLYQVTLQKKL